MVTHGGFLPFFLCCVIITSLNVQPCETSGPSTEVYVSDKFGNVIFKDGTVRYVSPIPVGNANYSTATTYDKKGLDTLYAFARSFVKDVMSEPFPFDLLQDITDGKFDLSNDSSEVVKQLAGLGACVIIGLLFVVTFIIGGCCFCWCRFCCGNCGGRGIQKYSENERCERMGLSQALCLMLICVFSAAVCVFITNDTFTDALHFTNSSIVSNIGDIGRFLNNTGYRFQYLVTDMYDLVHAALQKDLSNLGELAEADIFTALKIPQVLDNTASLDEHLATIIGQINQTMYDSLALQSASSQLSAALGDLADDMEAASASCAASCAPNLCATLDTDAIRAAALNVTSLPDLNTTLLEISETAAQNNFTELALSAQANIEAISETIDNAASDIKTAVNTSVMEYYDLIHGLADGVFKEMTRAFPTQETTEESTDIIDTVLRYDKYRRYFGLTLTSIFLALVVLFAGGMALGIACYDSSALPTERNSGSNFGGNVLLVGVGFACLLGALFMVLTVLVFLFGALLEKGCEPVEDLGYFKEFLDKGKAPGYSLSDITLGTKKVDLSTYDVLLGCRADQTPWTVLKMSQVVPLEDYLVYLNYLGALGRELAGLQQIDVSAFQLVTTDLAAGFDSVKVIGPSSIDFTAIDNVLQQEPVSVNTSDILATMGRIRDSCRDPLQSQWSSLIVRMESIKDKELLEVQQSMGKLRESSLQLQNQLTSFYAFTLSLTRESSNIDLQLKFNMTSILLQASVGLAGKMLSYVDSYATEVTFVIYNNLGNCRPLWNLYRSASIVLCDYGVDTLNGYWFSIGWGLFFFAPIVIVAAKLANHYKTMDVAVGYEEFDDLGAEEDNSMDLRTTESAFKPSSHR